MAIEKLGISREVDIFSSEDSDIQDVNACPFHGIGAIESVRCHMTGCPFLCCVFQNRHKDVIRNVSLILFLFTSDNITRNSRHGRYITASWFMRSGQEWIFAVFKIASRQEYARLLLYHIQTCNAMQCTANSIWCILLNVVVIQSCCSLSLN